jgi:glutamate N-acetyltransferase/amino-acid N-acetyltransferase
VSVTAALGFRAAGVAAGLKPSGDPDVALVVNDGPGYAAAGVFTGNRVQAAPVLWSRQVLTGGRLAATVLNSGGANACTGPAGFAAAHRTGEHVAERLAVGAGEVAVCSTGLIGAPLDLPRLLAGVDAAAAGLSADGGADAAQAILTTDTVTKQAVSQVDGWTVGGMAKGAGMLAPELATLLVVLTTDAVVDAPGCDRALRAAAARTFDRIDSDGCMSTNDTVVLMASGASGRTPDPGRFDAAVGDVCARLARALVADAEGAEHDIAVHVVGAASDADALQVGRAVARSNLLKCAIFGRDPNWGRVLSAVGTTSADFAPDALDVTINGVKVCVASAPGEARELVDLSGRQVDITVALHAGDHALTVWTSDLTPAYVHENSAYST